jgi:hypothetical protein
MISAPTPSQLANEVRLKRSQFAGVFLLVEGAHDSRFYRRFIDPVSCRLVVCFSKANVLSAVSILDQESFPGVVGLVDHDFDWLDGKPPTSKNVVTCDCHDLESMLVRSPALEAVLHEHGSAEKIALFQEKSGTTVRQWLLSSARSLGYLRWNSIRMGLNLSFEGLHFSRFIDIKSLVVDETALRQEIRNNSQAWQISDQQLTDAGWPPKQNHDPWYLCCGHDLVELLAFALRRAIGSCQSFNSPHVSSALRLAYSRTDFSNSALYRSIRQLENHGQFRVLSS